MQNHEMKILVAGDWHSELHEKAVFDALTQLGHRAVKFSWHQYFIPTGRMSGLFHPLLKAQNKYFLGPVVSRLNRDLIEQVATEQPDMLFIYRGTHVLPATLRRLRRASPKTVLVGYNNDDPFSPRYPRWLWRHFLRSVPDYDLVLAYRLHNLDELWAVGARRVELLRSWFIPERNHPVVLTDKEQAEFGCDVVFVGHYEDDGRLQCLEEIVRRGWKLRIFGPGYEWDSVLRSSPVLKDFPPVRLVWGREYNLALCGARIALCFFSKLNRDSYTRRCFEIPACETVLMSEYSDDMASLYRPDQEAVFFRDVTEMGDKVDRLLADPVGCGAIAAAGRRRLWQDRHDVASRMSDVVEWVRKLQGKQNAGLTISH